jgi:hypothetical protein
MGRRRRQRNDYPVPDPWGTMINIINELNDVCKIAPKEKNHE